jgi:hypothetical protein
LKIEASPSFTSNPVLAQSINDVGLVRNEEVVIALVGGLRRHFAKCSSPKALANLHALVVEVSLLGDVVEVERIGIGLVRERCWLRDKPR